VRQRIAEVECKLTNEQKSSAEVATELQRLANHLQEQLLESKRVPAAGATQSAQLSAAVVTQPRSSPYLYRQ
jgi:hypothetical protein